jgi:hypothetical protein
LLLLAQSNFVAENYEGGKRAIRKSLCVNILLLATVLIVPLACKAPAKPAEFEVISLNVTPAEATAGDTVTATAEVRNVGGSEDIYTAVLTVDGAQVGTKDLTVVPGATETVIFSLVRDKAGTYKIAIGEQRSSLTVKPKLVAKEVELGYDDGTAEEAPKSSRIQFGHLVDFLPPTEPFTIQKIRVFGLNLDGGSKGKTFDVQIWDNDQRILYRQAYPVDKFPPGSIQPWPEMKLALKWVELEIPSIEVSGKFYVYVWTGAPVFAGIHIGADNSIKNLHSTAVVPANGSYKEAEPWPLICPDPTHWWHDKSKVNWMIRVVGTAMVSEE